MNTDLYLKVVLPHVAQVLIFVLAVFAYRKRKEAGFFFLMLGLGVNAVVSLLAIPPVFGFGNPMGMLVEKAAWLPWVTLGAPLFFLLLGWAILAKGRKEEEA